MDPALLPPTAAGRLLAWLMNLRAKPSAAEIGDHLAATAVGEVQVNLPGATAGDHGLAMGLLAFGTTVRGLPGAVTRSEDALVRLELRQGGQVLHGVVAVDHPGGGKITLFSLGERPAEAASEADRVGQLYDRMAATYEQLGAQADHYWDRARAWLAEMARDGCTVLDVGCGPGHLTAGLPASVAVIGCDVSPEMIRLAALARPAGSFLVHDYHQPFPARWPLADVTVALGCLEFCTDLAQVARNLAAATKPEGRLLLTLPRAEPASPRREITLRPFPFAEITVRLREDAEVEEALRGAGLDVISYHAGPGCTLPGIGTVDYSYWDLLVASAGT